LIIQGEHVSIRSLVENKHNIRKCHCINLSHSYKKYNC